MSDQNPLNDSPFAPVACEWVRTTVLSTICCHLSVRLRSTKVCGRASHNTLFGPTAKPDINQIPFAVALMHVRPEASSAQDVQYAVEKTAIVFGWTGPTTTLRQQKRTNHRPFMIRQITSCHTCSPCLLIPQADHIDPLST